MGMSFFGPALVLLCVFLFIPMILTLIFSFTDFFALNPSLTHFTGLSNYFSIFKDEDFRLAFFNTWKFVLIIVPVQGLGALGLALLINKVSHFKGYFKVAFFLPVVMSLAVVSTLWIQIFSHEVILNALLAHLGIAAQPFINSSSQALPSIALMSAWQGVGMQMIIFLGGIQGINPALYEAAEYPYEYPDKCRAWKISEDEFAKLVQQCFHSIRRYYDEHRKKGFYDDIFGRRELWPYPLFSNAVVVSAAGNEEYIYKVNEL